MRNKLEISRTKFLCGFQQSFAILQDLTMVYAHRHLVTQVC